MMAVTEEEKEARELEQATEAKLSLAVTENSVGPLPKKRKFFSD